MNIPEEFWPTILVLIESLPSRMDRIAAALEHLDAKTLTKREQIAAMAMQGMLANPDDGRPPNPMANDALLYADALLAELGKEPK